MGNNQECKNKNNIIWGLISGLFVGAINGFFGGGGGMVVVPILIFVLKLVEKKAHATAIFIILPITIASAIIYLIKQKLEIMLLVYVGIGFIVGGIIGSLLLKKINNKVLRIIFAVVMIVAGIKMIV